MLGENLNILHWRDLTSEDVYHIAHLENESRDAFAIQLGKVAFAENFSKGTHAIAGNNVLRYFEQFAYSWLVNQADRREQQAADFVSYFDGVRAEPVDFKITSEWFNRQLEELPDLNIKQFAEAADLSRPTVYKLREDAGEISIKTSRKIVEALADAKGLQGEERRIFVESAIPRQA